MINVTNSYLLYSSNIFKLNFRHLSETLYFENKNGDEKLNEHWRPGIWLSKFNNDKKWITIVFVHICLLSNKLVLQIKIGKLTIGNIKSTRMSWIHTLLCCIFYEHQCIFKMILIERTQVDSATLFWFMERLNKECIVTTAISFYNDAYCNKN